MAGHGSLTIIAELPTLQSLVQDAIAQSDHCVGSLLSPSLELSGPALGKLSFTVLFQGSMLVGGAPVLVTHAQPGFQPGPASAESDPA